MGKMTITEKEKVLLKQQFAKVVRDTAGDIEAAKEGKDDKNSQVYKNFSLHTNVGKLVYKSFSNEELIALLKIVADEIGHSPSQGEVLWVLRDYLKLRFKKWPYALNEAGLARSAGSGGMTFEQKEKGDEVREEALKELRKVTLDAGRIPHPRHVPDLAKKLKKFYYTWGDALVAAGIAPEDLSGDTVYKIDDMEPEYQVLLKKVKEEALRLGRAPMHNEIEEEIKLPLLQKCGTWRNVLYQIGIEPIMRIKPFGMYYLGPRRENNRVHHSENLRNCYFKLLNPSEEVQADLNSLKAMIDESGHIPEKEELDPEMRKRLITACSSWTNTLYQLGIMQEPKNVKHNIKRKKLK